MSKLLEKLKANSTSKMTSPLDESEIYNNRKMIRTPIPAMNIALSGKVDGGMTSGLTIFAGPSKHFKSLFTLIMAKSYMAEYKDAVCLFYDGEFGTPPSYFKSLGMDTSRIIHTPFTNIEELKFDIMKQLEGLNRGDKVVIIIDSIGNAASKKEVEDALNEKSVSDMTRAKQLKSLFRMVTPHLTIKDIPMVVVNHTYMEQGMFPKAIVSGGTGIYYSADNIYIVGRQQEKEGTEVVGYNFVLNVEKSRHTREKSKIPINVMHEGGISPWSGLMEMALDAGIVIKPSNGWYCKMDFETGEIDEKKYRLKDTENKDFWFPILKSEPFKNYVKNQYGTSSGKPLITEEEGLYD